MQPNRWLLLRGLGREAGHWDGFPEKLRALGQEVEFLDLPGTGTEFARKSPLTIAETVEDLRRRRSIAEPVAVIAISLGGMVALDWAARYPGEISRLVVINSSVSGLVPPWKRLKFSNVRTGLQFLTAKTLAEKERAALVITTGLSGDALESTVRRWVEIRERHPVTTISILRQLVAAVAFKLGPAPKCPVLIVKGEMDRLVDPICSDLLAEKIGASLAAHPSAGHDLPLDEPEWLAKTVTEWASASANSKPRV